MDDVETIIIADMRKQIEDLKTERQQRQTTSQMAQPTLPPAADDMTRFRLEALEQYNRRDCLIFHNLYEEEGEDTTIKVVQTAKAMGIDINPDDISISHRLSTRNRSQGEPKPIIAKFTKRTTKNAIYQSKHALRFSQYHFDVFIREHLTKERSRAVFQMKKAGIKVTTQDGRLHFSGDGGSGVIDTLTDLESKLKWTRDGINGLFFQQATRPYPTHR